MAVTTLTGKGTENAPALNANDGANVSVDHDRRGRARSVPMNSGLYGAALSGQYYSATNPTPGTGIPGIVAADGYDATEALCMIENGSSVATNTIICPDFIELRCTVVDANGTNVRYDIHCDDGDRYTSGGSTLTNVPVNTVSSAGDSDATVRFGALVAPAASATVRYIGGGIISSTDLVADDVIRFEFGRDGSTAQQSLSSAEHATLNTESVIQCPPICIKAGQVLILAVNSASQSATAATWSVNMGWFEV